MQSTDEQHMNSETIDIRAARPSDLPGIVELLADDLLGAPRERPGLPLAPQYLAAFAEMSAQHGNELFVAAQGDELLGCLQLTIIPGISRLGAKRGQIEGVRVSKLHRGRGVGEKLMHHAIERARTEGCSLVQLTTDGSRPDARRFYEKLGFVGSHVGMKLSL
jgi:ribosomal protein S18 acetylase RimI-like enzyme